MERRALRADEQPEVVAGDLDDHHVVVDHALGAGAELEGVDQPLREDLGRLGLLFDRYVMLDRVHGAPLLLVRVALTCRAPGLPLPDRFHRLHHRGRPAPRSTIPAAGGPPPVSGVPPSPAAPASNRCCRPHRCGRRSTATVGNATIRVHLCGAGAPRLLARDRLHPRPDAAIAAPEPPEESALRLLEDLVLDVVLVDTQLVERCIERLGDGATGRLHPLHGDRFLRFGRHVLAAPVVRLVRNRSAPLALLVVPATGRARVRRSTSASRSPPTPPARAGRPFGVPPAGGLPLPAG